MGYLVCEKCGGIYKLQPGEKPEDFTDECECGGKLKYVENLDSTATKNMEEMKSTITCPRCGTENPEDAKLCKSCKRLLRMPPKSPIYDKKESKEGILETWNNQSNGIKIASIIGVCCLGLILIVGISGMLSPDKNTVNSTNQPAQTSTPSQSSTQAQSATWHSIATFTGTGDKDTDSFTTKGNKFKIQITGTTSSLEYGSISFFAYPEGETKSYVGQGSIDKFSQNTQSDESIVTASPGNYYLSVIAANMDNWNIQVFDYY